MMFRVVLALTLAVAPCTALKVASDGVEYNDPCPFGYGTNCGGGAKIDSATRDQVANILGGILSKLSNHKDLVQVKGTVVKQQAAVTEHAVQASTMSTAAAEALKGLLGKLSVTKQAAEGTALGNLLAAEAPTDYSCKYFGACGGGDGKLDSATKDQVAKILEGILGNLQSHKDF